MKKLFYLIVVIVAVGFTSCTAQSPKANLKTQTDSLSYSLGMSQTNGLLPYVMQQGVDTAYIADFIKGVVDGSAESGQKETAYMIGLQIGQQIAKQMLPAINSQVFAGDSTQEVSKNNFMAGFIAGTLNKNQIMSVEAAQQYTQATIEAKRAKSLEAEFGENKAAGEQFLAENKTKEGVQTTESGLQYKIIKEGKGATPAETDRVKVHYKGTLIDGTEFDSSYSRNEPTVFGVNQVIKGWTEALTLMPVGSKWELYIPQEIAYGSANQQKIKPFSTLIFEVELISIEK